MNLGRVPRRQWWVWLPVVAICLALGLERSGMVHFGSQEAHHRDDDSANTQLLPVALAKIAMIEIVRDGARFFFLKSPADAEFDHVHDDATEHAHEAQAQKTQKELVQRSLGAFGRTRIKRKFVSGKYVADYEFQNTKLSVSIYTSPRQPPLATYTIGGLAPDTLSRYIKVEGTNDVMTIAQYQVENLNQLLDAISQRHH